MMMKKHFLLIIGTVKVMTDMLQSPKNTDKEENQIPL